MLRGLAEYRVLGCLGSGAQGSVFLAWDTRLSRRVAIKIYRFDTSQAQRRQLQREAWQLTRVSSDRITAVYDVVAHKRDFALVREFVSGCDLASLLDERGAMPLATIFSVLSDIASGLAALRRAKVVHGDLRAANVLITSQGRAVLTDFGLARSLGEVNSTFSREALAPEQLGGQPGDLRSDFFALGVMTYHMLFAQPAVPFDAQIDQRRLRRGLDEALIPHIPGCSDAIANAVRVLLTRLLAPHPEDRYQSTFELREAIRFIRQRLPPVPAPSEVLPKALLYRLSTEQRRNDKPLSLPSRLVNLPATQQSKLWLQRYWAGGSWGARAALLVALLCPFLLASVLAVRPGACVAIAEPQVFVSAQRASLVPSAANLRQVFTTRLKMRDSGLVVLGSGAHSDSRPFLTPLGMQDICTAQHSIHLSLDCGADSCAMDVRSIGPRDTRLTKAKVAVGAGLRDYISGIDQAIDSHLRVTSGESAR